MHIPTIDPADASAQAIELYDSDHDGALSTAELAACPGILGHLSLYDLDGDGSVSPQELEARFRDFRSKRIGLTSLRVRLRMNGRPLPGAKVKLIPEPYLGDEVKAASGRTSGRGIARMDIHDDDSPSDEKGMVGVHFGTYKVEVTHTTVQIPAKYNTQTTLGYETEPGNPILVIELKSR